MVLFSSLGPALKTSSEINDVAQFLHKPCLRLLDWLCLGYMTRFLKYDIFEISDTSLLNSEVIRLSDRIDKHIPGALRYACRHLENHLHSVINLPRTGGGTRDH